MNWFVRQKRFRLWQVVLVVPLGSLTFAVVGAILGALVGLVTGLLHLNVIAAIFCGLFFFITYPSSRRKWGYEPDVFTYLLALSGSAGGGLSIYFVGNWVR